MAIVNNHTF